MHDYDSSTQKAKTGRISSLKLTLHIKQVLGQLGYTVRPSLTNIKHSINKQGTLDTS